VEKLSYTEKLRMQKLREQGLGEKAIIIFHLPSQRVKVECSRVDRTGSAVLRKPGSGRPATASACAVSHVRHFPIGRPYQALKQCQ